MKSIAIVSLALVLAIFAAGCRSSSVYDYAEAWVIREDPVLPYSVPADVIYVQHDLLDSAHSPAILQCNADEAVGKGKFDRLARVFSPIIIDAETLEEAMEWYFCNQHPKGRPFVLIGEGVGGRLLKKYYIANKEELVEKGLAAVYFSGGPQEDFVTKEMLKDIESAVHATRFRSVWGRDLPPAGQNDAK